MRKVSQQTSHPKIVIPPACHTTTVSASEMIEMDMQLAEKRRDSSHLTPTKSNTSKKMKSHEETITNSVASH